MVALMTSDIAGSYRELMLVRESRVESVAGQTPELQPPAGKSSQLTALNTAPLN